MNSCYYALPIAAYFLLLLYSVACAPGVFFRLFKFRDTPEYAFAYFISCFLMSVTLLGATGRIAFALRDARRNPESTP